MRAHYSICQEKSSGIDKVWNTGCYRSQRCEGSTGIRCERAMTSPRPRAISSAGLVRPCSSACQVCSTDHLMCIQHRSKAPTKRDSGIGSLLQSSSTLIPYRLVLINTIQSYKLRVWANETNLLRVQAARARFMRTVKSRSS